MRDIKKTINVWGIKFDLLSMEEFIDTIELDLNLGHTPIHITGVNPETVVHSKNDISIQKAILESDYVNIDNTTILKTLKFLGYDARKRVATPDLFESLLQLSEKNKLKVYILGAKELVLNKAILNIKDDYPGIKIKGHHGFYDRQFEKVIIDSINDYSPDMLFIALPSPEKEKFILKYKNLINVRLFLGVGGAIDCRAGLIKRAPKFLRENGLEGIHRAFQNPIYFGKKYIEFYPKFFKIVFFDK